MEIATFLAHNTQKHLIRKIMQGLLWWLSGKESACQCRRQGFNPWVGKISYRRAWQPTPVFLPGEFVRQRSLVGYSPWGRKELDTTEQLSLSYMYLLGMMCNHWEFLSMCSKKEGDSYLPWQAIKTYFYPEYDMVSLICGIQNMTQMNLSMKQTHRHRQTCGCPGWGLGWGREGLGV